VKQQVKNIVAILAGLLIVSLASFSFAAAPAGVDWKALEKEVKGKDVKALTAQFVNEATDLDKKTQELTGENNELDTRIKQVRKIQDFYKGLYADDEKYIGAKPDYDTYVVVPGDWLSKLAEYPQVYGWGNYARWPEIYHANTDLIKDPDLIYPGWVLKIPRP
jgi:nucleoid-associated protein YgaU